MPVLDASGRPVPARAIARVRADASVAGLGVSLGGGAYEGAGNRGTFLAEWPALLTSADRAWLPARRSATARVHDLYRNDPIAGSAVARKKNAAVGKGWRLSSRPNARALGVSLEAARELGAQIETEFTLYGYGHAFECDAERRQTFGQQLRLAVSHLALDGEFLAVAEWGDGEPTRYQTRLRVVDPGRLCNPRGRVGDDRLRDGVEYDQWGAPARYHIRERHPSDLGFRGGWRWQAFDRFTDWGRPQVFHGYEVERAGQTRGISRFVNCLGDFRGAKKYKTSTIEAAAINALIIGFMKSNAGPEAAAENFEVKDMKDFEAFRQNYYAENPVSLASGARLPVLPYGDEIELKTAARDTGGFDGFMRSILRLIAAGLGLTYEELTMDYSQVNYSSARAAMVHAWAETQALAGLVEAQLAKPFFVAWLEEAFDRGYVAPPPGAPDFYDAMDAYAAGRWLGPGRGYVDPTKEIDAAAARIEAGVSTLEDEAAEQGKDWREVLEQRALENAEMARLGLTPAAGALALAGEQARQPAAPASALARVAQTARSPEHEAVLSSRSAA